MTEHIANIRDAAVRLGHSPDAHNLHKAADAMHGVLKQRDALLADIQELMTSNTTQHVALVDRRLAKAVDERN